MTRRPLNLNRKVRPRIFPHQAGHHPCVRGGGCARRCAGAPPRPPCFVQDGSGTPRRASVPLTLRRDGPRPRRVARPRAECQRPRGAFVRAIREECLNRLILFRERRLRRASMRPGALTSGAELSGARQRGPVGPPDRPRPSKRRSSAGPRGRLRPRLVCLPGDLGGSSTGSASSRSGRRPVRARVSGRCYGIPSADSTGGSSGAGPRRQDGV